MRRLEEYRIAAAKAYTWPVSGHYGMVRGIVDHAHVPRNGIRLLGTASDAHADGQPLRLFQINSQFTLSCLYRYLIPAMLGGICGQNAGLDIFHCHGQYWERSSFLNRTEGI